MNVADIDQGDAQTYPYLLREFLINAKREVIRIQDLIHIEIIVS